MYFITLEKRALILRVGNWLFIGLLMSSFSDVSGQIDNEFWFAAPAVTEDHGDRPVLLRMASFDQATNVVITQPANPSWQPIEVSIPANQSRSVDLTFRLHLMENEPPLRVLSKGLLIQSDHPITAYYEVNHGFNPDIFALKGRNALGLHFMIPAQNWYSNFPNHVPKANSTFDIVATQNDTEVQITPSVDIPGHSAGNTFTIMLDQGQTYSVVANSHLARDQLTGSIVEASAPIAITLKDDSNENSFCYDLGGDQLVPIDVLGTEYIVNTGFLQGGDRVFIMAVNNQTEVVIAGDSLNPVVLDAGDMHSFPLYSGAVHIKTSEPVYVVHATGFGCEIGLAVVPRIDCTGAQSVSFTRSTDENFGIFLIVKKEYADGFVLNGSTFTVPGLAEVEGSGNDYVSARVDLSAQSSQNYRLSNSKGSFQLGVINGGEGSGTRYGYFSDFKSLKIQTEASLICVGATAVLTATGTENFEWFGHPSVDGLMSDSIAVDPPVDTEYGVVGWDDGGFCRDTAYLNVEVFEWPKPKVASMDNCLQSGSTIIYLGQEELSSIRWVIEADTIYTESDDSLTLAWDSPGVKNVELLAENPAGCQVDTSILLEVGGVHIHQDSVTSVVRGQPFHLDPIPVQGDITNAQLSWSPPEGLSCTDCLNPEFTPGQQTLYTLTVVDSIGCTSVFSTLIHVDVPLYIPNAFSPNNDGVNDELEVFGVGAILEEMAVYDRWGQVCYRWSGGSDNGNSLEPHWNGRMANSGQMANPGVYVCIVKGTYEGSRNPFVQSSDVTLIR